eukprot:941379-Lingulodinium_polyedra.AAC.1
MPTISGLGGRGRRNPLLEVCSRSLVLKDRRNRCRLGGAARRLRKEKRGARPVGGADGFIGVFLRAKPKTSH